MLLCALELGRGGVAFPSVDLGLVALQFVVLLFSLSFHEMAHAWTADRLGDPTPRFRGRLTLNPAAHVDLLGTIVLPLVAAITGLPLIGWAVPVSVDTRNLRRPRRDHALIAAAGPASNVALALAGAGLLRLSDGGRWLAALAGPAVAEPLLYLLAQGVLINLLLAVFNLIPLPPLDGSWVLGSLLPPDLSRRYDALRPYGVLLLYVFIFSPLWKHLITPVVQRAYGLLL
jgi:Zn-dependent protease